MKKIIVQLIAIIIFLSACQRTPEEEVVKQRNFKKLLEENRQTEREEYPKELSDEFASKDGKVTITFDAKVIAPDVDKFPVIQIDPQPITKEIMQLVVDEFMDGETGHYPENYMTKGEIEEKLLDYYAQLDNDELIKEKYEKHMPEANIDYEAVKEGIKYNISKYTAMLENAPGERENIPSYYNLRPDMFYHTNDHNYRDTELAMTQDELDFREANPEENLYLVSDKEVNGDHLRLIVYNELPTMPGQEHNFGLFCREHYEIQFVRAKNDYLQTFSAALCSSNPTNGTCEGVENFDVPYPELTISEQEAVKLAQKVLEDLSIDNFYPAYSNIKKESPSVTEFINGYNPEELSDKFYLLIFKPEYNGVPLINVSNKFSEQEITYLPFSFEEIKVKVSNDTIVEFQWSNPTDISNVLNESANLLSFDEISEIAKNHMKLKYNITTIAPVREETETYEEDLAKFLSAEIKISEIRLGLGGTQAYNNADEYMLIPVWSFYGTYGWDCIDDERDRSYEDLYIPLVSVNAVDGSIIEETALVDVN